MLSSCTMLYVILLVTLWCITLASMAALSNTLLCIEYCIWHVENCAQITAWQEQLLLYLVSENLIKIGENESSPPDKKCHEIRDFYCHQVLFFTGDCTSDVSSRCSVFVSQQFFCRIQATSHNTVHKPFLIYSQLHPHPIRRLLTTTACLAPPVLYFQHPKFDETCPNEG